MNAKVVTAGTVRVGDEIRKVVERDDAPFERPVDKFRRSAVGAVVSAGLLGLRDAMEGRPEREEIAIVNDAPAQPQGEIELLLDPDHPDRSIAIVRQPEKQNEPTAATEQEER